MLLINKFKRSIFFPKNFLIFKEIFFLALPLIFSQLSRVFMGLVDLAMVAGLGPEALAATASGGIIVWSVTSVVLGIKTSVQTVSSRSICAWSCPTPSTGGEFLFGSLNWSVYLDSASWSA